MYFNGVWKPGSMQTIRIKLVVKVVCFGTSHQKACTLKFLDIIEFHSWASFFPKSDTTVKIQSYQIIQKLSNMWLSSVNVTVNVTIWSVLALNWSFHRLFRDGHWNRCHSWSVRQLFYQSFPTTFYWRFFTNELLDFYLVGQHCWRIWYTYILYHIP